MAHGNKHSKKEWDAAKGKHKHLDAGIDATAAAMAKGTTPTERFDALFDSFIANAHAMKAAGATPAQFLDGLTHTADNAHLLLDAVEHGVPTE